MSVPIPSLIAYRLATALAEPFAGMLLRARARRGKEDRARLGERLGRASVARPPGPLVWLHGVSVGEGLSLLPLVEALALARPDAGLLVTSGTRTSAQVLATRLPPRAIHQYAPVDAPGAVRRFLNHWRPDLAVFVESELWPNLLLETRARGAKTALLSAKLSDKSFRNWSRTPGAAHTLLGGYDLLLAQDNRAAERLVLLGVCADGVADLKFGAAPLPVDEKTWKALRKQVGARPVIVAASTHAGEDQVVLDRFRAAPRPGGANPLLVIVPRHPERGPAIAALARERGSSVGLQSAGEAAGGAEVYVADVLGELGLWYRLAHLAIVGGSLLPGLSGHNPLEPARLNCPFVSGRNVANWATAYSDLEQADATRCVDEDQGLAEYLAAAIERSDALAAMARRARAYVETRDNEARAVPSLVMGLLG
jgi:3-deoxy-D-manno-octulosonic-acid transferase